jgi:wyosine [tRNA(Phe)-imidazoG37] synthetase (radical SAM superfamily)
MNMNSPVLIEPKAGKGLPADESKIALIKPVNAFAYPRDFLKNRFVYFTISPRARGLSIGVNLNPDRKCNFDCVYCEVDRTAPMPDADIDCDVAAWELEEMLRLVQTGSLRLLRPYQALPQQLLQLRHVALSGDGEPTQSPKFLEAVEAVVHVRARGFHPFFKIVLITNASGLDRPEVQAGLALFTPRDEIWAKLEVGAQESMDKVNRSDISLDKITENILLIARRRPVVIQSLFCQIADAVPTIGEIEQFARRLLDLKTRGAHISLVQIYSATRPTSHSNVRHLPLKSLSEIANIVRRIAGLRAEAF